jgi:hypothetical protein
MFAAFVTLAATMAAALAGGMPSEASSMPDPTAAQTPQLSQLLGFVEARSSASPSITRRMSLVRVDPETLRPLPEKAIAVGTGGSAARQGGRAYWSVPPWTVSPDGADLLVARNDASSLRLVNVRRMRVAADVRIGGNGVGALAWFAGGRVLAVQEAALERQRLIAVDLARRKVAARGVLEGSVVRLGRTERELVMLLAPGRAIGPARIAVADPRAAVRFVRLGQIAAGSKLLGTGSDHRVESRSPGLAVDPEGRRAFVVDRTLVAEVDLRNLTVSYHAIERPASLLARRWNWLQPAAQAKQVSGYVRSARWLSGGLLAVSGTDTEQRQSRPSGLLIIDTTNWKARLVDREATSFVVADTLLLATGETSDPATSKRTGIGVAAYGLDGGRRFQVFDGESAWLAQVHGGHAYVGISGEDQLRIVDLATGRVVGERRSPLPWLVQGVASGWWEP